MFDIEVGDEVLTPNGIAIVTQTNEQGLKPCYRIYFDDNTFVDACNEHLWSVSEYYDRVKSHRKNIRKVLKTEDMIDNLYVKGNKTNFSIDVVEPLHFNEHYLPINPYLIGCLLGDGGMTGDNTILTSMDDEIIFNIKEILVEYKMKLSSLGNMSYNIINDSNIKCKNYIKEQTDILGIRCKSEDKFIPKCYLFNSINN